MNAVLDDPRGKSCAQLLNHEYVINIVARYVKFTALTFYGDQSVLGYFNVDYDMSTTLEEGDVFCPGIFFIYLKYLNNFMTSFI